MTPSSWRRYRRILVESVWRDLLICGLFFMIGMAAIVQLWEWPKSEVEPIPVKPSRIVFPKEMLVQYQAPAANWVDPNRWMLSPQPIVSPSRFQKTKG